MQQDDDYGVHMFHPDASITGKARDFTGGTLPPGVSSPRPVLKAIRSGGAVERFFWCSRCRARRVSLRNRRGHVRHAAKSTGVGRVASEDPLHGLRLCRNQ